MAIYPAGTRVSIPEGGWVTLGGDWGRVLQDTSAALLADAEIEASGRVRQDAMATTTALSSILMETGAVLPIPPGTDLRIPAGLTLQVSGGEVKTVPVAEADHSSLGVLFFLGGIGTALLAVLFAGLDRGRTGGV
jgi:hypothetical protein